MLNKLELYNKYSEADVYLEENAHVYVHKKTGYIYNSVTTALGLFKAEFNKESVIEGIGKQYDKFTKWYYKNNGTKEDLPEILRLYVRYNKQRPYVLKNFQGRENKVFKALNEYSGILELKAELEEISKKTYIPRKAIYLNPDYSIMSKEQILKVWDATNLCSRHYGHMIHESIELYLIENQGFEINKFDKLQRIQQKWDELKILLAETDKTFNEDFFSVYIIEMNLFEFIEFIIHKFKSANPILGEVTIAEKVNFSEYYEICGTSDVEIILDRVNFKIGDHKTNKQFTFVSEFGNFMKPPFDYLEDCSMATYTMQLNTYGYMQEEGGRRFNGGWITYFDRDKKAFDLIDIPIKLDEAKKVLDYFKNYQDTYKERFLISGLFDNIEPRFHNFLTKVVQDNIVKRTANGTLSQDKKENRVYYNNLVTDSIKYLKRYI